MADSLNELLFGPVSEYYCNYFYILSFVNFLQMVFFSVLFITGVYMYFKNKDKIDKIRSFGFMIAGAMYGLLGLALWIQNRLLFNMCKNK